MSETVRDGARAAHVLESFAWCVAALFSIAALASTLGADFPARDRALVGEVVLVASATALMLLALRRLAHAGTASTRRARWAPALVAVRVVVGVPVHLFWLVAAAAGFAA